MLTGRRGGRVLVSIGKESVFGRPSKTGRPQESRRSTRTRNHKRRALAGRASSLSVGPGKAAVRYFILYSTAADTIALHASSKKTFGL